MKHTDELYWRPMVEAPRDKPILVFCPGCFFDLPDLICVVQWSDVAGWTVDELRFPTHWLPCVPPSHLYRGHK